MQQMATIDQREGAAVLPGVAGRAMSKRSAAVDHRDGKLIVTSSSGTDGPSVMNGWFQILDDDTDDDTLGAAVCEALKQSANPELIANAAAEQRLSPRSEASVLKSLFKAVGTRSYRAYTEGTRHVLVGGPESNLHVVPSRNAGPGKGFLYLANGEVVDDASPRELARAVRRALERCT